jgi:hypothetical protein
MRDCAEPFAGSRDHDWNWAPMGNSSNYHSFGPLAEPEDCKWDPAGNIFGPLADPEGNNFGPLMDPEGNSFGPLMDPDG